MTKTTEPQHVPIVARSAAWLNRPVDASSLAVFRMGFAVLMVWEAYLYLTRGRIESYWTEPIVHFTFYGFGWVQPLGHNAMYAVFGVLGVAAIAMFLGLWYRVAALVVWLCFTYQFLLEQARYLNHFYAASLFALFLVMMPAHAVWSVDSTVGRRMATVGSVPAWTLYLIRFQTGIIYFFAGIAKLNADWMRGDPVVGWMRNRDDHFFVRIIFDLGLEVPVFAWGGLLVDLLIFPALLWKRTRWLAFIVAIVFHMMNHLVFQIGIFPPMMVLATAMFFPPDWPRRIVAKLRRRDVVPAPDSYRSAWRLQAVGLSVFAAFVAIQLLMPLRHHLYPGDVAWTEEGHRFSWRMMLRAKTGNARFVIVDSATVIEVELDRYLRPWQQRTMATRPDMLLQLAHFIADEHEQKTGRRPKVYANSAVSLNRGPAALILKENVDLAAVKRSLLPADWIKREP